MLFDFSNKQHEVIALAQAHGAKYKNHTDPWKSGADNGAGRVKGYEDILASYESTFIPGLLGEMAFESLSGVAMDRMVYEIGNPVPDFYWEGDYIEVKTASSMHLSDMLRVKTTSMCSQTTHYVHAALTGLWSVKLIGSCSKPPRTATDEERIFVSNRKYNHVIDLGDGWKFGWSDKGKDWTNYYISSENLDLF